MLRNDFNEIFELIKERQKELQDEGLEYGIAYGVAIKRICEEEQADIDEVRTLIATTVGKNKWRHQAAIKREIEDQKKVELLELGKEKLAELKAQWKALEDSFFDFRRDDPHYKMQEHTDEYCLLHNLDAVLLRKWARQFIDRPISDNADKYWAEAMADGKLTEHPEEIAESYIEVNRRNAMKKWAREIVADESVDEITRYKVKTKYKV